MSAFINGQWRQGTPFKTMSSLLLSLDICSECIRQPPQGRKMYHIVDVVRKTKESYSLGPLMFDDHKDPIAI